MSGWDQKILELIRAGKKTADQVNEALAEELFPAGLYLHHGGEFSSCLRRLLIVSRQPLSGLNSVALVSSRLPRDLENHPEWFDHFRTAILNAKRDRLTLLTIAKTTCDRFIRRACQLFGCPLLSVEHPSSAKLRDLIQLIRLSSPANAIWVWPPTENVSRDDLLIRLAQRVLVLKASQKGQTLVRVTTALSKPDSDWSLDGRRSIYVATDPSLIGNKHLNSLLRQGAIGWHLTSPKLTNRSDDPVLDGSSDRSFGERLTCKELTNGPGNLDPENRETADDRIIPLAKFREQDQYLYHCTRARTGPWPDQASEEFIDELLFSDAKQRTPLAVLTRMIRQHTICASASLNRCRLPVVSFTQCKLSQIKQMRVYRSHLARWDFEPFGIGMQRDKLIDHFAACRVQYGATEDFEKLPSEQQPYFQLARTRTKAGTEIDWTMEQEWRVLGDVDFHDYIGETGWNDDHEAGHGKRSLDPVIVFVPTMADAQLLVELTDLPIIVVHDTK